MGHGGKICTLTDALPYLYIRRMGKISGGDGQSIGSRARIPNAPAAHAFSWIWSLLVEHTPRRANGVDLEWRRIEKSATSSYLQRLRSECLFSDLQPTSGAYPTSGAWGNIKWRRMGICFPGIPPPPRSTCLFRGFSWSLLNLVDGNLCVCFQDSRKRATPRTGDTLPLMSHWPPLHLNLRHAGSSARVW